MKKNSPELLHKSFQACGVKAIDEEQGIVEAFVAGIGNKDSVNDIIVDGAFVDSLKARLPKGVWSHDWDRPVSKTLDIYEVPAGDPRLPIKMQTAGIGGLYVKTQFNLETQDGRDALSWVKFFGDESEWSIGYKVKESEYDKKNKAMLLKKIDLFEYSPVLFGANPLTSTVGVKVLIEKDGINIDLKGIEDPELSTKISQLIEDTLAKADEDGADDEVSEDEDASVEEEVESEEEEKTEESDEKSESDEGDIVEDSEESEESEDGEDEEETEEEDEKSLNDLLSPVVEYAEKMFESISISSLDAAKLKSFIDSRVSPEMDAEIGLKEVPGSYEARIDMIEDALEENMSTTSGYCCIRATFDTSVVWDECDWMTGEETTYQATYTVGEDGTVTFSDQKEVELVEVVVAKAALMDALFKGFGLEVKKLLAPLVEISDSTEADEEVKSLLAKAGASISAANSTKLKNAIDAMEQAKSCIHEVMGMDMEEEADKTEEEEIEEKTEESIEETSESDENTEESTDETTEEKAEPKEEEADTVELDAAYLEEFNSILNSLDS